MGIKITLPYDPEWQALDWAKENCRSYITNRSSTTLEGLMPVNGGWVAKRPDIEYYFGDERDAVAFALKWR